MFARKYGFMSKFEKKLIWGDFFRIFWDIDRTV